MPAPSNPLRQQTLEAIQTKLRAINGNPTYFSTVKSTSVVLDPGVNMFTVPSTELPFFIVEPTPEGSKFYMPAMRMQHRFQVVITARNDAPGGTSTSRKMETWERLIADIEVAMTRDVTLGGIAADVRLTEATPGFDLNAQASTIIVVQPLNVLLVREYGKPWNS